MTNTHREQHIAMVVMKPSHILLLVWLSLSLLVTAARPSASLAKSFQDKSTASVSLRTTVQSAQNPSQTSSTNPRGSSTSAAVRQESGWSLIASPKWLRSRLRSRLMLGSTHSLPSSVSSIERSTPERVLASDHEDQASSDHQNQLQASYSHEDQASSDHEVLDQVSSNHVDQVSYDHADQVSSAHVDPASSDHEDQAQPLSDREKQASSDHEDQALPSRQSGTTFEDSSPGHSSSNTPEFVLTNEALEPQNLRESNISQNDPASTSSQPISGSARGPAAPAHQEVRLLSKPDAPTISQSPAKVQSLSLDPTLLSQTQLQNLPSSKFPPAESTHQSRALTTTLPFQPWTFERSSDSNPAPQASPGRSSPSQLESFLSSSSDSESPVVSVPARPSTSAPVHASKKQFNVVDYGAEGDGKIDNSKSFLDAWEAACDIADAVLYIPSGTFEVYPTTFSGPCQSNLKVKVEGTVMAPKDPKIWSNLGRQWLNFKRVSMIMDGPGTLDGQGQQWWSESCKTNPSNPCKDGPTALVFDTCTGVTVENIAVINAQQMHIAFEKSSGIRVSNVHVISPGTSPNTDGIHLQNSSSVVIENTVLQTGDDCISIQTGSFNVTITNISCGPGHGISIGGLGKNKAKAEVANMVVDGATFTGSTNGVRIKSWQGSTGYVSNITFKNIHMENVKNSIIVDQFYCDSDKSGSCPNYTSNVKISDIKYDNVHGTSANNPSISLHCSATEPCKELALHNIDLTETSGSPATSSCFQAYGIASGVMLPANCLLSN